MNIRTDVWETLMVRVVVAILAVVAGTVKTPFLMPTAALLATLAFVGYIAVGAPSRE
jgi:hypothetical protein